MKRISLIILLITGAASIHVAFAQRNPNRYSQGKVEAFRKKINDQLQVSAAARKRSILNLNVSAQEHFDLAVNVENKPDTQTKQIIGEVQGIAGSEFFIRMKDKSIDGHIILRNQKRAFKCFSEGENAYTKEVDIDEVLCIDYRKMKEVTSPTSTTTANAAVKAMPDLQSFPGARGCVLLDFDGHYVSGTYWNNGNPIDAAHSGMTDAQIQESWEIVSEDFRPFHMNVTTNEAVFNAYPKNMRMRCIITPTNTAAPGAGGVAYIGSFNWNDDTPCWVFVLGGKGSAEAASHEIGHTLGLGHDGRTSPNEGYFAGHGDWAPIMGVGYYRNVSQWSKGEYNFANNKEDDLSIMASATYNVGYRDDDHGNSTSASSILPSGNVNRSGIIERTSDIDFFSFNTGGGTVNLTINTVSRHGNLNISAVLYNSSGSVLATSNPAGLNASLIVNVAPGTYYVSVDNAGEGNPAIDGYSDYASLGSYSITGNIPAVVDGVANVYQDCAFGGAAILLPVGDYTLTQLLQRGVQNDWISSIKVSGGYELIAYLDDNFSGSAVTFTGNDDCIVDNGINDLISSIRVRKIPVSFSTVIEAEAYGNMAGVQPEPCSEGGTNIGWIDTGDWMAFYNVTIPATGSYLVEYRVASAGGGGVLTLDHTAGAVVLGQVTVPGTGGWQNWTTVSHVVNINAGTYNFGICATAGGWNLNWFKITSVSQPASSQALATTSTPTTPTTSKALEVWPNPAIDKISVTADPSFIGGQVTVVDGTGHVSITKTYDDEPIDIDKLSRGFYVIIITKNGKQELKRFRKD